MQLTQWNSCRMNRLQQSGCIQDHWVTVFVPRPKSDSSVGSFMQYVECVISVISEHGCILSFAAKKKKVWWIWIVCCKDWRELTLLTWDWRVESSPDNRIYPKCYFERISQTRCSQTNCDKNRVFISKHRQHPCSMTDSSVPPFTSTVCLKHITQA